MNSERKKELKTQYANRHPEMGIVGWQSGERLWIAASKDTHADHNSTAFQLELGSWPNREMQRAYTMNPASFSWFVLRRLDYDDPCDDLSDDLQLLLMICREEYPEAESMLPGGFR